MRITYEVVEHKANEAFIHIHPDRPINGFHGVELWVIDAPEEKFDEWVKNRVIWKLTQELGNTMESVTLVEIPHAS